MKTYLLCRNRGWFYAGIEDGSIQEQRMVLYRNRGWFYAGTEDGSETGRLSVAEPQIMDKY
jgi:hypothetical protein